MSAALQAQFLPVWKKFPKKDERHRSKPTGITKGDKDTRDHRYQAAI